MSSKICTLSLSLLAGACALALPSISHAGTVGYYNQCMDSGDISGVAAAAGHTTVNITSLDAASLNGLSTLVVTVCPGGYTSNAAVNTAVSNGMGLVFERLWSGTIIQDSSQLPGAPTFSSSAVYAYPEADDLEIAAGAPIATGPGGTLTSTSLDRVPAGDGFFSVVNWYPTAALPAGAIPFITTSVPGHVGAFGYPFGSGRVVYTDSQWTLQLPGGAGPNSLSFAAGGAIFLTNAIAWAGGAGTGTTTCASEGYKNTQLIWCKNICESTLTGKVLDSWIHRWIERYRQLPYCALPTPPAPV